MLRNARLSARSNYSTSSTYLPRIKPSTNASRLSGRTNSSRNTAIYKETTNEVMQTSMPAFRCGTDVILFDEKRRLGQRTHMSINMRGGDYRDPISSERVRLSRYNDLFDTERAERMKNQRGNAYNPHGNYLGNSNSYHGNNFNRRGSKLPLDTELELSNNKLSNDPFIPPVVRQKSRKLLTKKASVLSSKDKENHEETSNHSHTEVYDLAENGYNYPYDHGNGNGYGNGYGNSYGHNGGYHGGNHGYGSREDYQYRNDDGNYLPRLNDSWYQGNEPGSAYS